MDFDEMTDGQILIELKRSLSFCDQAAKELSRRGTDEPERDASL
jgi:hypothetical protein